VAGAAVGILEYYVKLWKSRPVVRVLFSGNWCLRVCIYGVVANAGLGESRHDGRQEHYQYKSQKSHRRAADLHFLLVSQRPFLKRGFCFERHKISTTWYRCTYIVIARTLTIVLAIKHPPFLAHKGFSDSAPPLSRGL
jgi:hypothetical protein